jgi:molecular chaperone GrpE
MAEEKTKSKQNQETEQMEAESPSQGNVGETQTEMEIQAAEGEVEDLEIELTTEDIVELQKSLAESEAKAAEYLDGWQRARAELINYKKRTDRDRERVYQDTTAKVVRRYLEILDDLERALKDRPQEGQGAAWAEGIELIYQKLKAILQAEGIEAMKAQGDIFDPNLHEAIAQTDSDEHESGEIIEVIQEGYLIGDRVLRPAVVRVAA